MDRYFLLYQLPVGPASGEQVTPSADSVFPEPRVQERLAESAFETATTFHVAPDSARVQERLAEPESGPVAMPGERYGLRW